MGTRMLVSLLSLGALVASASADCDACVAGLCYSRRTLVQDFQVTGQLAVDRTTNVLYTQLKPNLNTAIYLDHNKIQLLNMIKTSGMTIDQDTRTLYMAAKDIENTFYKYTLANDSYTMETLTINTTKHMNPNHLYFGNGHLHFIDYVHYSVQYLDETDGGIWQKRFLKNYILSDFVIDHEQNYFLVSNNTVYMYKNSDRFVEPTVIYKKSVVLSSDKNGEVYFGDASERVIYKRDKEGNLGVYASYKTGGLEEFIFEKDNGIVFRDADGSVARWVRAVGQGRCMVVPPRSNFFIGEIQDDENFGKKCLSK